MAQTNSSTVNVVLTVGVPEPHLSQLRAISPRYNIVAAAHLFAPQAAGLSATDLAERDRLLRDAEVIYNYDRSIPDFFAPTRTPKLRWTQTSASSIHQAKLLGVFERDIVVTNMGGVAAIPSSEWAFWTMIDHVRQGRRLWQNTLTQRYERFTADELFGELVVICALGRVGRRIATLCHAFGMRVWGTRRRVDTFEPWLPPGVERVFSHSELADVLPEADFLVLSLPNTAETRHYIGAAELARLKPSCFLVNVGRGSTLDYTALIDALNADRLAGAAVDVFQDDIQPLPAGDPLWTARNILIAPHTAAMTGRPQRQTAVFAENLRRYLAGERLMNIVDPAGGY